MPCYSPLCAIDVGINKETGKKVLRFLKGENFDNLKHKDESVIPIPCGQCIGCRLERSRQWAIRCVFEADLYDDNCFITLTYDDDNIPAGGSLRKDHFQKFMKRLRKKYVKDVDDRIRYFECGEYGENFDRPHYHACLFNFDFKDKVLWDIRDGVRLYRSESLEKLWPYGYSTIGDVTFESSAYVARYIMKKITGGESEEHYKGRLPEYVTMSRRPGLAKVWYDKYKDTDVLPADSVVVRNGVVCKPPKYFDKELEKYDKVMYNCIKEKRREMAKNNPDNSLDRLKVREVVKKSKIKNLRRGYETSNI